MPPKYNVQDRAALWTYPFDPLKGGLTAPLLNHGERDTVIAKRCDSSRDMLNRGAPGESLPPETRRSPGNRIDQSASIPTPPAAPFANAK